MASGMPAGAVTPTVANCGERLAMAETVVPWLKRQAKKKKVTWKEGTVDNEFLGRRCCKKCCVVVYRKLHFDHEDCSNDDDDNSSDASRRSPQRDGHSRH